jgi:hypothetical protein
VLTLIENQNLNLHDAVWAPAQIKFTYEMLELTEKITAMATYTAISSEPPVTGDKAPLTKLSGDIPRQRVKKIKTEEDYRNEAIDMANILAVAQFRNTNVTEAVRDYLEEWLFDLHADIAARHRNSLNYALGQVKSKGKLTLTAENNPRGLKGITFDLAVPDNNYVDLAFFTKEKDGGLTPITGVDPVKKLRGEVRRIKRNYYSKVKVRLSDAYASELIHHPEVIKELGFYLSPILATATGSQVATQAARVADTASPEALLDAFKRAIEADELETFAEITGVDRLDSEKREYVTDRMDVFEFGMVSISPIGDIISIRNVTPFRDDKSGISAWMFDKRGLIEYRYDAVNRTQTWVSELTALPTLMRPKDMYYYNTLKAAE